MVSTRNHPRNFPAPTLSPSKALSRSSDASKIWAHKPSNLTLLWLIISLPVVVWDTGYVLLRPYSLPGGIWNSPIWSPYQLYATIDYIYGWPAFDANNGWPNAQATFNLIETLSYTFYLYLVYTYGHQSHIEGVGAPSRKLVGWLGEARVVTGPWGAIALLIGFGTSLVTLWKTILYFLIEHFTNYGSISHNSLFNLIFLWIIPNSFWIVFPVYMTYTFGEDIFQGLATASRTAALTANGDDIFSKDD